VTNYLNTKAGVALGDAMPLVEKLEKKIQSPTINSSFPGTAQAF
jgi:hypothetical protein